MRCSACGSLCETSDEQDDKMTEGNIEGFKRADRISSIGVSEILRISTLASELSRK
ncbi:hypothetical protein MES5069_430016 [Mesorhizobium escarrei]|uniref:Uncharacterized protein n=1 Tax=Mesorhizobium escarrei TaxID=666018 RepID=A0ABM9E657_9HYPH|nr:hypothetical protein MES5069_430016 [Mesorhizobium escarrei]